MGVYQVDERRYYFEDTGQGEPLVLLHGFTGSSAIWRPLIEMWANEWRIIAIDILGHGRSSAPATVESFSMQCVMTDLGSLLSEIAALPAHWLGYSMGGRLALATTINHPAWVKSLILESGSPGIDCEIEQEKRRRSDEALADRIEREGIEAFVAHWEKMALFASQENLPAHVKAEQRANRLANKVSGLANSLRGMGTGAQIPLWDRLSEIKKPVLLIAGELDYKFVAINRRMADSLQNSRLMIVPKVGHTVHLENTVAYSEIIRAFLRETSNRDRNNLTYPE